MTVSKWRNCLLHDTTIYLIWNKYVFNIFPLSIAYQNIFEHNAEYNLNTMQWQK